MRRRSNSSVHKYWAGIFYVLSFCFFRRFVSAVLYSDGQSHSIETSLNDSISLRSSSTLTLPSGGYTIRSPSGSDSAIRLAMSSTLNATGGDVIGGDASTEYPAAAVGIIVGSASRASFWDGVSVRGGNDLGADRYYDSESPGNIDKVTTHHVVGGNGKGHGGDSLVSQYIGSNVTIQGGNFIAGHGSVKDGHSLLASYEAHIHVYGGSYYGSWMARDHGSIVVNGCLSKVGTRLVGRLQNGHSLDVQVFEERGGKIILNTRETCNSYRKSESSAARAMGKQYWPLLGIVIVCLRLAYL